MNTDDLIAAISRDAMPRRLPHDRALIAAGLTAIALAAAVFFLTIGLRPDIADAAQSYRFVSKFVVTGLVAAGAIYLLDRLARPGAARPADFIVLAGAPALLVVLMAIEALLLPEQQWAMAASGKNSLICLTYVPLIGIGPLVTMIWVLRNAAPTRPGVAGAVAGIVAGGIAASFYAAHCTDDSPFFVAIWYSAAIALLAIAGSVLGRLFARF